jgi:type IV pilus assembly protein PilM
MSLWNQVTSLVKDPPPSHIFELSEAGIAFAKSETGQIGFQAFEPGTLVVSPVEDNVIKPDVIAKIIERIEPAVSLKNGSKNASKKPRPASVILPDYAARVSLLDFDSFPSSPEDQLALIKFRVKKTIPFDIDSAAISYCVQPAAGSKNVEVIVVTVSLDIIARYEALFRNAGFQPGEVTTSALAALNLYDGDGVAVVAKLSGHTLSVMVVSGTTLKLFRCVTLEEVSQDEMRAVLHPTFAYVEDELGSPARKLFVCGFSPGALPGLDCQVETLRSPFGVPGPFDAGLLGYMKTVEN